MTPFRAGIEVIGDGQKGDEEGRMVGKMDDGISNTSNISSRREKRELEIRYY